jgi:hypothetical protein
MAVLPVCTTKKDQKGKLNRKKNNRSKLSKQRSKENSRKFMLLKLIFISLGAFLEDDFNR